MTYFDKLSRMKTKYSFPGSVPVRLGSVPVLALMIALGVCPRVFASGFGLYEASAKTYAMGGAVLGKAADASANFHNPATLTDFTNIAVTVGFMTEHPRARMKVTRDGTTYPSSPMNSGCYVLPHFHLVAPLPWDLAFGLGIMPEYGLGSEYDDSWRLNYGSTDTQVQSFTVNPNLAWKATDKLSVGAGLRFLYWDFEQYSRPYSYSPYYNVGNRLKGDNRMKDFGYQIGLKYDFTDDFSMGLTYKSPTVCHVEGKSQTGGYVASPAGVVSAASYKDAEAVLEMPQSVTGGFNWDITEDWHLGGIVSWTQWSVIDQVHFNFVDVSTGVASSELCRFNWKDTWRFGLAPSWDFADGWTWIASYVFETDCAGDQYSTMLPPSERHMLSTGLCWSPYDWMEIALTYGMIIMDGKESHVKWDRPGDTYQAYRGISHAAGLSVTFRF